MVKRNPIYDKHDFSKNTNIAIVDYLVNKTMRTTTQKNRKNLHLCANLKSGKFRELLSPCNDNFKISELNKKCCLLKTRLSLFDASRTYLAQVSCP